MAPTLREAPDARGRKVSGTRAALRERIDLLEESYEFFLAYAAQGVEGDEGKKAGPQLREYLGRLEAAVAELAPLLGEIIEEEELEPASAFQEFREVIASDAKSAGAALTLVASRPSISSQLVDNLNASMHLRALLTDLFLLDELLGLGVPTTPAAAAPPSDEG